MPYFFAIASYFHYFAAAYFIYFFADAAMPMAMLADVYACFRFRHADAASADAALILLYA